jgi:uncharacterized repeat protein (TIGR02543 family)
MEKTIYINGKRRGASRSILAFILSLCMVTAYVGIAPIAAYAGDPEVSITVSNAELPNDQAGNVTLSTVVTGAAYVSQAVFSFNLNDGGVPVPNDNWKNYFNAETSTITGAGVTTSLAAWLAPPTHAFAAGDAVLSLDPLPVAAGHSFTYNVTVSAAGITNHTSNTGTIKVADPTISSIAVTNNEELLIGTEGAITLAVGLTPGGVVTGVTTTLNLKDGDTPVKDWTTFFDEAKSTIQYGQFPPALLSAMFSAPADLYPGVSTIKLVPLSVAAGHSFTYDVTVTKGQVTAKSNPGKLKVLDNTIIVIEDPEVDDNGIAEAEVKADDIISAIEDAKAVKDEDPSQIVKIEIDVPAAEGAKGVAVSLPKAQMSAIAGSGKVDALVINTEAGDFELNADLLAKIVQNAGDADNVTLSVTKDTLADIPQMAGAAIFDIELLADTKVIHGLGADIRVSLPYTLKSGETADSIKVYYIPEEGNPQMVSGAVYDSETGKISFSTDHLSLWAVKYVPTYNPNYPSYAPLVFMANAIDSAAAKYKVTFDANGGKVSGKPKLVKSFKNGAKLGNLNTATRKNYKFGGWYTKKSGGDRIGAGKRVTKSVTYYAHWQKKAQYGKIANASSVNVRKGSKSGAARIGSLKKGQTFKITDFINRTGKSNDWYKFSYKGKTGYVNAAYVTVSYK